MKLFFDENFSKYLASGMSELQSGVGGEHIDVLHIAESFGKGKKDDEWIPEVAKIRGIVITQDIKIARTRTLAEMCKRYKLGIFFVKPPKSYKYWDLVKMVIYKWGDIKEKTRNTDKPFAYIVTPRKLERLSL